MDINKVNLKKIATQSLREQLTSNQFKRPSKKDWVALADNISTAIRSKDFMKAINGLTIAVFFEPAKTFEYIRRKGMFRYFQQINGKNILPNLVAQFKETCEFFNLMTPERAVYLDSVIKLTPFHKFYTDIEKRLVILIREFNKKHPNRSLLKTLLVYSDFLFLMNYHPKPDEGTADLKSRNIENICSAISFLIYFHTSRFTAFPAPAAEEYITEGHLDILLLLVCNYLDLREYEILVEHFGYSCRKEGEKLIIEPPFPELEKSIRLGYIRTEVQHFNDLIRSKMPNAMSLHDLIDKIIEVNPRMMFEKTADKNYPRYRMILTEKTVEALTKHFIKPNEVFLEEAMYLGMIIKEQLLTPEELLKIPFKENLTLFEFIKARRWFLIMGLLLSKYLDAQKEKDIKIILRTLVSQLSDHALHELLDRIITPDQVDTFLDILCWEPGHPQMFDLQYQPLLYINGYYEIPLFVFAHSNAIRNLYASQYKQSNTSLMKDGRTDVLVYQLVTTLNKAGIKAYTSIAFGNTDIDVCCIYGNTLYVFECKHTLHPVSVFDLRTMFDHIRHAEHQLGLIEKGYDNDSLLRALHDRNGIAIDQITEIRACIIVSNRLFNGDTFRYPIRYIKEVQNMLLTGEAATASGVYRLWPEEKLTPTFMREYFGNNNGLSGMNYDCLTPRIVRHDVFHPIVEFHTFSMVMENANTIAEEFMSRFHKISDHENK